GAPWERGDGLRLGLPAATRLQLQSKGEHRVLYRGASQPAQPTALAVRRGEVLYVPWQSELHAVRRYDPLTEASAHDLVSGGLTAPMNGSVVRVLVSPGQQVEAGSALLVLEAMKMEHSIRADQAGTVKRILFAEGDMVSEGRLLLELEPG